MKRRLLVILIIPCLLLSMVAPFINPPRASALASSSDINNATFSFQDRADIVGNVGSFGQVVFSDQNIDDSDHNYKPPSNSSFCDKHGIDLQSGRIDWTASTIYASTIELGYYVGQNCHPVIRHNVAIANPADPNTSEPEAAARFQWDGDDITSLSGQSTSDIATFYPLANAPPNTIYRETSRKNRECGTYAFLSLNPSNKNEATLYIADYNNDSYSSIPGLSDSLPDNPSTKSVSAYSDLAPYISTKNGCAVVTSGSNAPHTEIIAGQQGVQAPGAGTSPNNPGSASLDCTTQLSQDLLSWIICPVVNELVKVIGWVDNIITNEMDVKTDAIFCSDTNACKAYYAAWQSFRDIALGLMVIAGLVLVMAEALGLEMLDAYTIRKTLPRLLIAAIAITLSWPLMRFLIQLSDDLGFGVRSLIYSPFSRLDGSLNLSFGGGLVNVIGSSALVGGAVATWMLAGGALALLSFLGTAALAVLVAVIILILRQIAIILLMLLAPLALVAYILPNTQRIYRMWWESFSKALLMFPLIAAFIATGRVFSAISVNNGGAINQMVGFAAYFAPYFMIPLTLRMAGSTVGALGNFVNSRSQGGFGALSNLRGQQRKSRLERIRGRGLYRKNSGLTGALNKFGHATFDADERLPYVLGSGLALGRGKYNPIGIVGKRLLGRQAAEQAAHKGHQFAEQTAKAQEKTKLHYSAGWAGLGMRSKLKDGMTQEGLAEMDRKYGLDANGNRTKDGVGAVSWQAPKNGDYHGLVEYGETLAHGGIDGSHAQYGGSQLVEKAGDLASFGNKMETQRATLASVSALAAAQGGKLNAADLAGIRNRTMTGAGKEGPAAVAFANDEMAQLENASTQNRQDLRLGKGIRIGTVNGVADQAYSVYGDQEIQQAVLDEDGNVTGTVPKKAYESKEALDSLMTAKAGSIGMGKGEYFDDTRKAYLFHANQFTEGPPEPVMAAGPDGKLTPVLGPNGDPLTRPSRVFTADARELRKTLTVQAGIYSQHDPGAKKKVEALMDELGIDQTERQQYMSEYRAREAAATAGAAEAAAGGAIPGGGGPP